MDIYEPEDDSAGRFFDRLSLDLRPWDTFEAFLFDFGLKLVPGRAIVPESGVVRMEFAHLPDFAEYLMTVGGHVVVAEGRTLPKRYKGVDSATVALSKDPRFSRWSWYRLGFDDLLADQVSDWVEHDLARDGSVPTSVVFAAVLPGSVATCTVDSGYLKMEDYVYGCVETNPELQERLKEANPYE